MARSITSNRMRMPLMAAFRSAFDAHDAKRHAEERDEGGDRILSGRRASNRNAVSEAALQKIVSLDLEALMNTTHLESTQHLEDWEEARRSIVNYGIPDVGHRTIGDGTMPEVEREIVMALVRYEPRLDRDSIRVTHAIGRDDAEFRVRFVVRADLRCDPLNLPVEFVADVDSDTGKISVAGR